MSAQSWIFSRHKTVLCLLRGCFFQMCASPVYPDVARYNGSKGNRYSSLVLRIQLALKVSVFLRRELKDKQAKLGVKDCVTHELLTPYPVLHEKPGEASKSEPHKSGEGLFAGCGCHTSCRKRSKLRLIISWLLHHIALLIVL
jgi:hypothetical protein